jgi:hypothetical protein
MMGMAANLPISLTNRVASAGTNALEELRPLKPPVEIPSGWAWLWWLLAALLVMGLAAFGLWYWRRHRKSAAVAGPPPEPAHVVARRRLEAALQLLSDPERFTVAVSDVLRWYLEQRFHLPAPERTTEEFLLDLQKTPALEPRHKELLADFLQECDLVKFARLEPTEETLRRMHAAALRLADETSLIAAGGEPPVGGEAEGQKSEIRNPKSE